MTRVAPYSTEAPDRVDVDAMPGLVALEFGESETGSLKLASLLALGFILFVLSFIVLATSRYLLRNRLKA